MFVDEKAFSRSSLKNAERFYTTSPAARIPECSCYYMFVDENAFSRSSLKNAERFYTTSPIAIDS
jgi:hypothetical protein